LLTGNITDKLFKVKTVLSSDERLFPNDANVDADRAGRHGGAEVPAAQGQPQARSQLAQERPAGPPHGLQEDPHHRHRYVKPNINVCRGSE